MRENATGGGGGGGDGGTSAPKQMLNSSDRGKMHISYNSEISKNP